MKKLLRVMKFGGTSVGDAACIQRVAKIVSDASREGPVVVVVSAMSGVTNKLIEAATRSEAGDHDQANARFAAAPQAARSRSRDAHSVRREAQGSVRRHGGNFYRGRAAVQRHGAAPGAHSAHAGRSFEPRRKTFRAMVAAALCEAGLQSEAVEATKLIVTTTQHGGADPMMDRTREQLRREPEIASRKRNHACRNRFHWRDRRRRADDAGTRRFRLFGDHSRSGAGRGRSDHLDGRGRRADGRTRGSSRKRARFQRFPTAKQPNWLTSEPKCSTRKRCARWCRRVFRSGSENTFTPERSGTKITPKGKSNGGGVKALTAIKDVALVSLGGPGIVGVSDVLARTFSATAAVQASILLVSQSSSQNDICFIVAASDAKRTVEGLRKEFALDLAHENVEHITIDPNIAIVAVVGENMRGTPGVAGRTFIALGQENVNIIAIAQGSSESNISFVVEEKDMKTALVATHREFKLAGGPKLESAEKVISK